MNGNFIKIAGTKNPTPRNILLQDAHGRIVFANFHTRHIDGKTEYYPSPSCGLLSIYYPACLENIRCLLREDERKNNQLFDDLKDSLERLNAWRPCISRAVKTA